MTTINPKLPYWHHQLVLSWYHHQSESHQQSFTKLPYVGRERQTPGPIDRTPETPGSGKNKQKFFHSYIRYDTYIYDDWSVDTIQYDTYILICDTYIYDDTFEVLIPCNYADQNELPGKSRFRTKVRLGMKSFIAGDYPSSSSSHKMWPRFNEKQAWMVDSDDDNANLKEQYCEMMPTSLKTTLPSTIISSIDFDHHPVPVRLFMVFAQNMTQIHSHHLPSVKFALKKLLFVTCPLN